MTACPSSPKRAIEMPRVVYYARRLLYIVHTYLSCRRCKRLSNASSVSCREEKAISLSIEA